MATDKALYWVALGVVALVLVNGPHVSHQNWTCQLQDRAVEMAQRVSGGAMAYVNLAEMRFANHSTQCPRSQIMAARVQARLANVEVALARRQAVCARMEAERARQMAMRQF